MDSIRAMAQRLSLPMHCISRSRFKSGRVYLSDTVDLDVSDYIEIAEGLYVKPGLEGFDGQFLTTGIVGKKVYAPLHLYGGYIPTTIGVKILVLQQGEIIQPDLAALWEYKPISYTDEKTVADLYRNACAYKYDFHEDAFVRLTEKEALQNSLKLIMQKKIMNISGDAFDRIADLSRIVLFLLSKAQLSAEEQNIIMPLLGYAPEARGLVSVFEREEAIQEYVASVKNDPEKYLYE